MFTTTFASVNSIHTLTVDSSKEAATTRYLDTHNCEFSRYFSSNGYTRFTIFNAPASVIDSISKKYPAPAPVVEEVVVSVVKEPAVVEEVEEVPAPVSLLEHVVAYLDEEPVSADDLRETIAYLSSFLPASPSPQYGYTEADLEVEEPEEETQVSSEPRWVDTPIQTDIEIMTVFIDCTTRDQVRKVYRELSKTYHPDNGGDAVRFQALTREYEEALWLLEPALV